MNINVKENKKLDLNMPEFICDGLINKKMNKYPMLSHLNTYNFTIFCGRPASGKTSLMISFILNKKIYLKKYNNVIIVMPSHSRDSLKDNPFEKHVKERMFDELTLENLININNQLENNTKVKNSTLLILDDVGASLKDLEIQKLLRKIIYNRRHLKVTIFMLLQSFVSCPREIRKQISNCIIFKPSKTEFEYLMDEVFEMKRDHAIELLNFVFEKKYDYLFINVEQQKMYKDFNEIIINNL